MRNNDAMSNHIGFGDALSLLLDRYSNSVLHVLLPDGRGGIIKSLTLATAFPRIHSDQSGSLLCDSQEEIKYCCEGFVLHLLVWLQTVLIQLVSYAMSEL